MKTLHVLAIAGSVRKGSYNRALLRAAKEMAPSDILIELFDGLSEIPPYNEDIETEGDPEPVQRLKQSIRNADALLFATPEYNYSVPGILKNAVDWASRPPGASVLNGKVAAIMGASRGSAGTARAQLSLRQSFVFTRTYVLLSPEILVSRASQKFDPQGNLIDPVARNLIRTLLSNLREWTERFALLERAA